MPTNGTQAEIRGSPGIIAIISSIASLITTLGGVFQGWFTQRSWRPDVCGDIIDSTSEGGILNFLEDETGQTYPQLRETLPEIVDAWHSFQYALPWDKEASAMYYDAKLQEFANGVKYEAEKWAKEHGIEIAGVVSWIKAKYPYLIAAGVGISLIIALVIKARR